MQCTDVFVGFQEARSESPLDRLLDADTAISCAMLRSCCPQAFPGHAR